MALSSIDRLPAHTRSRWLRKLSQNFRPLGKTANAPRGRRDTRSALRRRGILLIEANVLNPATHQIGVSLEAGATVTATGGTPASFTSTGGFDTVAYASAGAKTITAINGQAKGEAVVTVP